MNKTDKIWAAIARYLDNSCTANDEIIIEEWLNSAKENKQTFDVVKRIWASAALNKKERMKDFLPEEDWKRVSIEIRKIEEIRKKERIRRFSAIRKRQKYLSTILKAAALIVVAFTSGWLTLQYAPQPSDQAFLPVLNEISTGAGEKANIQLGDGTKVFLSAETELSFPESFRNNSREVSLSGQAFFDVIPDENRPFVINTQNGVIKVLGTAFDVRSYVDESSVDIMVTEGVVEISHVEVPQNKLVINRGYKGTISLLDNSLSVEWVDDPEQYTGWKEGRLIFKEQPLSQVFRQIERWYDVSVTVDENSESILNKKFSANLKTRSVTDVMNVIEVTMDISFTIEEDQITVYSKGDMHQNSTDAAINTN
jgi:ferric-dicitrate binding protein FerR (iron transport regulator)